MVGKALLAIEQLPHTANQPLILEGQDTEEVQYHVGLLLEHGYVRALKVGMMAGTIYYPSGLTAPGHEFADSIRDDNVWERVKELSLKQTGSLTLEGIRRAAAVFIRTGGNLMATGDENARMRRRILEELPEQAERSPAKPFVNYRYLPIAFERPQPIVLAQLEILESEGRVELRRLDDECAVRLTPIGLKSLEMSEEEWQRAASTGHAAHLHISNSQIGAVAQVTGSHGVSVHQVQHLLPLRDDLFAAIERIVETVNASDQVTADEKNDCEIEADQLKGELRKSKPNPGRIKAAFEWFKRFDGAAQLGVHLIELGRKLNELLPGIFT